MRTVIIGGTFNPVHIGHLFLAEEVLVQEKFDQVLFVPSHKPAHKSVDGAENHHRMEMLQLAVKGTGIRIETCEMLRGGISYSIDTVRCVIQKYPLTGKPSLVIGDDLFQSFDTWKDAAELADLSDLLVAHRLFSQEISSSFPHRYLQNKLFPLSSTEIRQRIGDGAAWKWLVPPGISDYIETNHLYRKG